MDRNRELVGDGGRRLRRTPGLLLGVWLLLAGVGCASAPLGAPLGAPPAPVQPPAAVQTAEAAEALVVRAPAAPTPDLALYEESLGIRISPLRLTAGDFMLDFRFEVLDAAKAAPLFDRGTQPYLVDEAGGARFFVPNPPKTGPLRTSDPPQAGRVYWTFFGNPGRYLQRGARVSIVFGDRALEHLQVE